MAITNQRRAESIRVAVVAFDDFTDLDLIILWDLLNRVHLPNWSVRLVGDASTHKSMTGLTIPIHGGLAEANEADAVLFSSGKGSRAKIADCAYLAQFSLDPARQLVGSLCSGALLLAALGLLNGKSATTYPSARSLLEAYGVQVLERPIVINGNIATAGGCLAGQYLVRWVVERLVGKPVADAVIESCQPVGEGLFFSSRVESFQSAATR